MILITSLSDLKKGFNKNRPLKSYHLKVGTALCTTSFTPPFGERSKILNSLRAPDLAWLPPAVHSNCSEAVSLAARTLLLAAFLCSSVVIFVKYHKVSTRTILPNFIDHCGDSVVFAFWWRHRQKREKEEAYIKQVLNCFDLILLANQGDSPGQPKRSLPAATAIRYNYSFVHDQLPPPPLGELRFLYAI